MDLERDEYAAEDNEAEESSDFFRAINFSGTYLVNINRMREMEKAYQIIKRIVTETGSNAKITCKQHDEFQTMGYIDVDAEEFSVVDTAGLFEAASLADNTEIYSIEGFELRLTLTFHGLTKKVGAH